MRRARVAGGRVEVSRVRSAHELRGTRGEESGCPEEIA